MKNRILKSFLYCLLALSFYGNSCRYYDEPIILQKKKIYAANCKQGEFYVSHYYWMNSGHSDFHSSFFLDEKGIYWLHEGKKIYSDLNSDYLIVTSRTQNQTSMQVKISCKANNQLIIDTGLVQMDAAGCYEINTWFYFLDGHSKKKEGDSCFPKDLNIEGLKEIIKFNTD